MVNNKPIKEAVYFFFLFYQNWLHGLPNREKQLRVPFKNAIYYLDHTSVSDIHFNFKKDKEKAK